MNIVPFTIWGFVIDGLAVFGFLEEFLFFVRMMVQWISSERAGHSVIPISYWYLSVVGSVLIFVYAVARRDIVITMGQFIAVSVYVRNIFLYREHHTKEADIVFEDGHSKADTLTDLEKAQAGDFSQDYRLRSLLALVPPVRGDLLDMGSGNGEIANMLKGKFHSFTLGDVSEFLCGHLKKKFTGRTDVSVIQLDVEDVSVPGTMFDIVTMNDVIEHVADDTAALRNAYKLLKSGGVFFLSVPAYPFLYGIRDKQIGHYRRYGKKELRAKLQEAGFHIQRVSYFNAIAIIPYFISERILRKPLIGPARSLTGTFSYAVNRFFYYVLRAESLIRFLPFGITLVAVAEKPRYN